MEMYSLAPNEKITGKILSQYSITPYGKSLQKANNLKNVISNLQIATFGAGCFWGVEDLFREQKGVIATAVGYTGGHLENPSYKDVCTNTTGHAEVVQMIFDELIIPYEQLVKIFWHNHDPTTPNRQGPDYGTQYRSAIFYHTETQKKIALQVKKKIEEEQIFSNPIVTEIVPAETFYWAEDYHQLYLEKNGRSHCQVRWTL